MRSIFYLIISNNLSILGTWLLGPVYAAYISTLEGSTFVAGASWGVMALTSAAIMFTLDSWIDENNLSTKALMLGYVLLSVGSLGYSLITTLSVVYAIQVVNGLGMGLVLPSWKTLYSDLENEGHEVQEWGWADGPSQVITGVGSFFGGMIVQLLSFQVLFYIMAVLQLTAAITVSVSFPNTTTK